MKIFTTVGTTSFDLLIKSVDEFAATNKDNDFIFQIANGQFHPRNGCYFRFENDIVHYYEWADVVITHAGAGTIYKLLEQRKKVIIVPNLVRIDKHQCDIAQYMCDHHYSLVLWDLSSLSSIMKDIEKFSPAVYKKTPFFRSDEIVNFINNIR
ncbi:TPA: hypothetical protein JLO29_000106 [Escherichia coli]|nr:hypothetical protein [Escherichia coli]